MIVYWLKGEHASNASGKVEELGPFVASIIGCYYRDVTEEEINDYFKKLGILEKVVRIERESFLTEKGSKL